MLLGIARFELRLQLRNPVFWVSAAIFFLLGFGITASENVSIGTPGAVNENAPTAIAMALAGMSLFYLFVVTSFVANAIVRDDATGFGPIVRATPVTKRDFVLGRFLGGLVIAALGFLAVPLGMAIGTMMPWVDAETVGPNSPALYAWNYLVVALPNLAFACAFLFALATLTRSMMMSYVGVVLLVMGYLVTTSFLGSKPEYQQAMARFEPTGIGAISEATRYWTTAELDSRLLAFAGDFQFNRLFVLALALALVGLTLWRFPMSEKAPSRRKQRKLARRQAREAALAATAPTLGGGAIVPAHGAATARAQFLVRLKTEVRQVLFHPGLIILALLAMANTFANLMLGETMYGTPSHPTLSTVIGNVRDSFLIFLLIIAAFYGGELVWRERDRKLNEILDSTPAPSWTITVPKIAAIALVLVLVNLAGIVSGLAYMVVKGANDFGLAEYLGWFLLPATADALLLAILAVVVQVLSPNKYVGWGAIMVWFVATIFLRNLGFSNPLYTYAGGPAVPLSDMNGAADFWKGAALLQVYWLAFGVILVVLAHRLWPRGTEVRLRPRLARLPATRGAPLAIAGVAAIVMAGLGAVAHYNIKTLNAYRTSDEIEAFTAAYEKKYLKYEALPRPVVTAVKFDAQLYPRERRLDVVGHYDLRNDTRAPIREVHVRQGERDTVYSKLTLAGARLASDDREFGYRIFRFDTPLAPGATTRLDFASRIHRRGFAAGRPATDLVANGSFVNNLAFAPGIGMDRGGMLQDRTKRRRQGLPAELRPAKLEDLSATNRTYIGADWVTSDITLTTDADQLPIAPGRRVSDASANGRRTARFVATAPILNFFSIQSGRYAAAETVRNGVRQSIYYHPGHDWNVAAMQRAVGASLDYYRAAFGPYQFDYARVIEFPGYASFAQAFAGTMPYSESIGFAADVSDPDKIDFVTYVTAHEVAHQYWAHQVIGADMQGGTLTSETLAQYSALMVMKRLYGPDKIRRFLKYELDQYLRSRQGEAVEELPLARVENQPYIHYRKGSVALYLLQERLGEDAVNRALARFVERFRFKGAPYHRSVDLIAELRKEARTPQQQQLITDLFERITLYDLKVKSAATRRSGAGWTTTLTLAADKFYADGKGQETRTALAEPIEVGLFTARPGFGDFSARNVLLLERKAIRGGEQRITLYSKARPAFAGVDPYNFYVDRNSDDNLYAVNEG